MNKLYVLYHGYMYLDVNSLVGGTVSSTAADPSPTLEWTTIPAVSFLIDTGDGYILYDTGCDPLGMSEHWAEDNKNASPFVAAENGSVEERLRQLGLTPDDVGAVVMSHLHTDHSGGLYLFKKAKVYVSDEEFTQVAKLWALGVQKPAYDRWDMGAYFGAGLDWRLVERDEQELPIAPGVTILNLGSGHTYGLMALYVELEHNGNVLLVSDAIHTRENAGPPVRSPGMVYDSLGYAATVKRIFRFAEAHDAWVIFGHDTKQVDEMTLVPDGFYD